MKKLRYGMIGGGPLAMVGEAHRKAAALDGQWELVCGVFSSDPDRSREFGKALGLEGSRLYDTFDEMIRAESALPEDQRMHAVSIVTPNHLHAAPAIMALEHGLHVIVDKPLAFSLAEAFNIRDAVRESGLHLALTHTDAGYPMVKEAKARVASGHIGRVRKVFVDYPQGWLSRPVERDGNLHAEWRTDPARSGLGGTVADIGTHAAHLAEYVSGLRISRLSAMLNRIVEGRQLDDDAAALLQFEGGASGVLVATQIAAGEGNNLKLRIYGELGGLEWQNLEPHILQLKMLDAPVQRLTTDAANLSEWAKIGTRFPDGHPEKHLEAFANIYSAFAKAVRDHLDGIEKPSRSYDFPTVDDGVRGMMFIEAMVASSNSDQKWMELRP